MKGEEDMGEWRSWLSEHKHSIGLGVLAVQFFIILLFIGKWTMIYYVNLGDHEIDSKILAEIPIDYSSETILVEEIGEYKESPQKWMVDIKGEVQFPGIYEVEKDMRINDVIDMAGGLSPDADIRSLNLAQHVQDQMVIHVFNEMDSSVDTEIFTIQIPETEDKKDDLINLNTADLSELQKLSGIGEKKAEKIISYREENGTFKHIEELMEVSGIGEKTFETLKDKVTVSP